MLDELFDSLTDRSRNRHGKASGGLLGKLGQLLDGDFDGERRQTREQRPDTQDERDRYGASPRDDRSYRNGDDDDDDDHRERSQPRKKAFDFDFGD